LNQKHEVKSKTHTDDGFTSISYDNGFFLKMYRKIDPTTNPDLEITRYLSEQVKFKYIPKFCGAIEWKFQNDNIALGMIQFLPENHGDGYSFMLTRINNYIERILAAPDKNALLTIQKAGSYTNPVAFEELPEELQILLGTPASEQARLIGVRTGQMHLALAAGTGLKTSHRKNFRYTISVLYFHQCNLLCGNFSKQKREVSKTS
jgi:maltose alpha-D-glucosyltransferase/alpha-amylase